MRLRKVKGAAEAVAESKYIHHNPRSQKGNWKGYFEKELPLYAEIGMGKGKFITTLADQNKDKNYIGIELFDSVMIRAIEKLEDADEAGKDISNIILLRENAKDILEFFDKDELDGIYLNFSDPWPKDRHSKRRLTSFEFLKLYLECLKKDGQIVFKTDNLGLFDFSVEEAKAHSDVYEFVEENRDLHHSAGNEGNVMTEYEEKFSALGNPIYRMILRKK